MGDSDIYWDGVDKLRVGLREEVGVKNFFLDMLIMRC